MHLSLRGKSKIWQSSPAKSPSSVATLSPTGGNAVNAQTQAQVTNLIILYKFIRREKKINRY